MKKEELILILKRLYKDYVKKRIKRILLALILSVVVAGTTAATAWLLDPAVKKIFIDKDRTMTWLIPILIVFTFAAKGLSLYFARVNIINVGQNISGELQEQIAKNLLISDIQTLDNRHSGKYISNVMFDCGQVQQLVSTGVLNIMKDTFSLIALMSVMFYQNWRLSLFALIMMPLSALIAKTLGKRIGKATTDASVISGRLNTFFLEVLKGSKMIRIYQKEDDERKNAKNIVHELVLKNIKIAEVMIRATPIMEVLTGLLLAGFIFYSGVLISSGELGINNFFSFLAAMMLAWQPIRSLATINMVAYQGTAAAKRIFEVIDKPITVRNNENFPDLIIKKSDIKFKNVGFKYSVSNDSAVQDVNLDITGGGMTALVGHSGAGKSTIINLLPRFYDPQIGNIFIDNQNIQKIKLASLRENLSLVSQDVILFDDTVKANIAYAKSNASEEEIIKACEFAAADKFIEKLPQKYDTNIGENGIKLSGGQKQRISIARAILKKSPIILLDEATSSLDAESEEIVQNAIMNLTKNKTTLVIAHRLSTIHNADRIYVFKNGTVIDFGKHEELINKCNEYKSLYQKQLK
ncbi:MAG: ABC transporter ATP-binding protein [Pelagibacteraceae bacterium TMED170]|nr:MAG: ABC transporter ATP-binding protein [Pelagibacteraceae bacterium TMED170]|tara:strand:+ start:894 stop:2636 length:1743 start_codon:yes stop_codon:yes gene_type:complete